MKYNVTDEDKSRNRWIMEYSKRIAALNRNPTRKNSVEGIIEAIRKLNRRNLAGKSNIKPEMINDRKY